MPSAGTIPQRPYLLRAMHAWITDNGHTPHIVVNAAGDGVNVPRQYVRDGKIVLNISHVAANKLDIGNEAVQFQARFSGTLYLIRVPLNAVLGIYARETGRGMIFSEEEVARAPDSSPPPDGDAPPPAARSGQKARLKVVK